MEAAISNLVNEGDKVLSLVIGNFGEKWAKIAKAFGAMSKLFLCHMDKLLIQKN